MDSHKTHDCIPIPYPSRVLDSFLGKEANILYTEGITFCGSYGAKTFSAVDAKDGVIIAILPLKKLEVGIDCRKAFGNKKNTNETLPRDLQRQETYREYVGSRSRTNPQRAGSNSFWLLKSRTDGSWETLKFKQNLHSAGSSPEGDRPFTKVHDDFRKVFDVGFKMIPIHMSVESSFWNLGKLFQPQPHPRYTRYCLKGSATYWKHSFAWKI
ncbi:MAG: hypothetical protein J3Q66DRAFT_405427 [Benniella sp.]|nr:MAG: hypothetical protein J3Q66DRAFT_405427 [Benniella sp.]